DRCTRPRVEIGLVSGCSRCFPGETTELFRLKLPSQFSRQRPAIALERTRFMGPAGVSPGKHMPRRESPCSVLRDVVDRADSSTYRFLARGREVSGPDSRSRHEHANDVGSAELAHELEIMI